jgi:hypothetical protein
MLLNKQPHEEVSYEGSVTRASAHRHSLWAARLQPWFSPDSTYYASGFPAVLGRRTLTFFL